LVERRGRPLLCSPQPVALSRGSSKTLHTFVSNACNLIRT